MWDSILGLIAAGSPFRESLSRLFRTVDLGAGNQGGDIALGLQDDVIVTSSSRIVVQSRASRFSGVQGTLLNDPPIGPAKKSRVEMLNRCLARRGVVDQRTLRNVSAQLSFPLEFPVMHSQSVHFSWYK